MEVYLIMRIYSAASLFRCPNLFLFLIFQISFTIYCLYSNFIPDVSHDLTNFILSRTMLNAFLNDMMKSIVALGPLTSPLLVLQFAPANNHWVSLTPSIFKEILVFTTILSCWKLRVRDFSNTIHAEISPA